MPAKTTISPDDFFITFGLADNAHANLMVRFAKVIEAVHAKRNKHVSRQFIDFQASVLVGQFIGGLTDGGVRMLSARRINADLKETEYMYSEAVNAGLIVASEGCPYCAEPDEQAAAGLPSRRL